MYYKSSELVAHASESESVVSKNSESQASVELVANAVPFGPQATCNSRQRESSSLLHFTVCLIKDSCIQILTFSLRLPKQFYWF